ncbi:Phorbol esters/diacylglycerol binding domain protein [Dirofilaria immitis]|nr:Phorbol esters/diacylglycerol binding domain protein [Dirofilaria immitis]
MSKTLDYGANSNSEHDGKHTRSRQSVTQQSRWFSGLRARISQLNMPEWLSQLGVRNFNYVAPAEEVHIYTAFYNFSYPMTKLKKVECKVDQPEQRLDDVSKKLETCINSEMTINGGDTIGSWLWEEADYEDTLALQHFGPLKNLITGCSHPGKGHDFLSLSVTHPTWCDKCGDFMWGFLTRAVKCDNCNYTCHAKCRSLVTLDCKTADSTLNSCHELAVTSCSNLKVFTENDDIPEEQKDETSGFVQIHMNFMRPINVVAGDSLSFLDVTNESGSITTNSVRTITTFFFQEIPLKIEMIITLLRKFRVADNPRKFALYERICHSSDSPTVQNYSLTRISDESFPLKIVRSWEEKGEKRQLVLQENDTGDILVCTFLMFTFVSWYLDENLRNRGFTVDSDEFSSAKTNSCISTDV